jgi:hypothetical protein
MKRSLPLLAVLLLAGVSAAGSTGPSELEAIFGLFDHGMHKRVLKREGIGCTACHQVGGRADERVAPRSVDEGFLPAPPAACHYCHSPPAGRRELGPGRCALCHADVQAPSSHGAGWIERHGDDMRVGALQCEDCHRTAFCVDCHNRKERISLTVHDRTWITVHGIASRTDPTSCGTCHLQAECLDCHRGDTWGAP